VKNSDFDWKKVGFGENCEVSKRVKEKDEKR